MKKIVYCNFNELSRKTHSMRFPPQESNIVISKWLKIFYSLFLENRISDFLSGIDTIEDQLDYFINKLDIDQNEAHDILVNNQFYFRDNLEKLADLKISKYEQHAINANLFNIYYIGDNYFIQQRGNALSLDNSISVLSCIVKSLIESNCLIPSENIKIIFICHDKHISAPKQAEYIFSLTEKKNINEKIKQIFARSKVNIGYIQIEEIVSFQHVEYSEVIKSINPSNLTINSVSLIDRLKKQEKSSQLADLKKKLINLWLPLAIDMQGLGLPEVEDEKKAQYYKEIISDLIGQTEDNQEKLEYCKSLTNFPDKNTFSEWEEIKNELGDGYKNFDPAKLVSTMIENDYSTFCNDRHNYHKQFIGLNKENNPNFLPNWLQRVVQIIDRKIN